LTKSKPVFYTANSRSSDYETIEDAEITITCNGENYEFYYEPQDKEYEPSQTINLQSGSDYTLTVNSPEFGVLKSTQTMPQPVGEHTIKIDSTVKEYETDYRVAIELDNPLNTYYRMEVFGEGLLSGQSEEGIYVNREYFKIIGSENQLSTSFTGYKSFDGKARKIYMVLSSITEDYYNYGRLLKNYDPQNPFAEPTLLPSNMEGGLGMFALSSGLIIPIR
jgi:hypothetical protein